MPNETRPPRDNLVRAQMGGYELTAPAEGSKPKLRGHFLVFDQWTEIESAREGHFMETIAPGSAARSLADNPPKVTFNHGHDPSLGDKVLGTIEVLREDEIGAAYEVDLFDGIDPLLRAGLEKGAYGASFRFGVDREDFNPAPGKSDHNPEGIPERVIREMHIAEFGPVTFPAYAGATAAVRSMTDEYDMRRLTASPQHLRELVDYIRETPVPAAEVAAVQETSPNAEGTGTDVQAQAEPEEVVTPVNEEASKMSVDISRFTTVDDLSARMTEIATELAPLVEAVDEESRAKWDALKEENEAIEAVLKVRADRLAYVTARAGEPEKSIPAVPFERKDVNVRTARTPDDIYDLDAYRTTARSYEDKLSLERDGAKRSVEAATFGNVYREDNQAHIVNLLETIDEPAEGKEGGELARRILSTGSPVYKRALTKYISGKGTTSEERTALADATGAQGGFALVYQLDPTLIHTSAYSINPYRAISRLVTISGTNEWRQPTSGAITAAYGAEAAQSTDNSPVLAQIDIFVEKAQAFVPFSIEIGQDWGAIQTELASLLQEAKDDLEATQFTTGVGHGSNTPKGVVTGATAGATAGGSAAFAIADLYKLWEALPARFRPNAQWLMNLFIADKIRQFDTAGGSGVWQWDTNLAGGQLAAGLNNNLGTSSGNIGARVLGKGANEATAMPSVLTTGTKILLVGDFSKFIIVDRIGMNIEVVPLIVGGANHYPTGQRGLYAYWRNSSDVATATAFQYLTTG